MIDSHSHVLVLGAFLESCWRGLINLSWKTSITHIAIIIAHNVKQGHGHWPTTIYNHWCKMWTHLFHRSFFDTVLTIFKVKRCYCLQNTIHKTYCDINSGLISSSETSIEFHMFCICSWRAISSFSWRGDNVITQLKLSKHINIV